MSGILKREEEERWKQQQKKKDEPKVVYQSSGTSPSGVLVVVILILLAVFILPLIRAGLPVFQVYAPDAAARVTELSYQQNQLLSSMTDAAATSTAQAWAMQVETQRQEAILSTSVAQATSTQAAQTTSTAWSMTQTPMAAEQIVRDLELAKKQKELKWAELLTPLRVIFLTALGLLSLFGLVLGIAWAFVQFVPVYVARKRIVKEDRGERTIHVGANSLTRVDLMPEPTVTFQRDGTVVSSGGMADEYAQERITANAAKVKAVQGYAPGTRILKGTVPQVAEPVQLPAPDQSRQMFPRPSWSLMDQWNSAKGLPYGASVNGLETMRLENHPHVGVLGKTGSGKSRRFLRPFIAAALASGQQVIIVGKQVDFWPFAKHPNATLVPIRELTIEHEAEKYVAFLHAAVMEMNRRDMELTKHRQSTWAIAGRENTLIVLDELGNALDLMPKAQAEQSYRYIRGLTKEGRKVGFNIVFATQRAKGFRDIMTQVGRAVFFVEDEQESRFALGVTGAETLTEGYFYSKFGSLKLTAAFEPTDDELTSFLAAHQVAPLQPQTWIDAHNQLDGGEVAPLLDVPPRDEIADLAEQIRSQWEPGMSLSKTSQLLGKPYAGPSWIMKVKKVAEYLTSTAENTPPTPENGR
jgi:hypothetical protein